MPDAPEDDLTAPETRPSPKKYPSQSKFAKHANFSKSSPNPFALGAGSLLIEESPAASLGLNNDVEAGQEKRHD